MEDWVFKARPSVHVLCKGAFLQRQVRLASDAFATPLSSVGYACEADFAFRFSSDILGRAIVPDDALAIAQAHAEEQPAVVISVIRAVDADSSDIVSAAWPTVVRVRSVMSWISGDLPEPFAVVVYRDSGPEFSFRPPFSRRRQRLELSGAGDSSQQQAALIFEHASRDAHFAFALALYQDALRDSDAEMRVSRFFMCLESLAFRLKGDGVGSRAAIRKLLGLERGAFVHHTLPGGRSVTVDRVEIAGRVRDKLLHGIAFDSTTLNSDARDFYEWARTNPGYFRDFLARDCELELLKWANGTSAGRPDRDDAL